MALLQSYIALIDEVIIKDEGGWKLTSDKNDNDGGWTFAGVTKKTWDAYVNKLPTLDDVPANYNYSDMAHHVAENFNTIQDVIRQIYYEGYIVPLSDHDNVQPAYLSCAINCGIQVAEGLMKEYNNDYQGFLTAWHKHYFDLIRKNAEAWRDYATALENIGCSVVADTELLDRLRAKFQLIREKQKPITLRAEYIDGWFNRVERYRNP